MLESIQETPSTEQTHAKLHDASTGGDVKQIDEVKTPQTSNLTTACAAGDLDQVKTILSSGADLSDLLKSENKFGQTPLHVAAANGFYKIVELILKYDDKRCVKSLLNKPDCLGYTPYYLSICNDIRLDEDKFQNSEKTARLLLDRDIDFETFWFSNCPKNTGYSHLHQLIARGFSSDLIEQHLNSLPCNRTTGVPHGINELTSAHETPLHLAAYCKKEKSGGDTSSKQSALADMKRSGEIAEILLNHGADPVIANNHSYPPLYLGVLSNNYEYVKTLLQNAHFRKNREAVVQTLFKRYDDNITLLHLAVKYADLKMLELLFSQMLELTSDKESFKSNILNAQDSEGNTAAHLAAQLAKELSSQLEMQAGKVAIYEYLVEQGADVTTIKNVVGESAQKLRRNSPPRPPSMYDNKRDSAINPQAGAVTVPQSSPALVRSVALKKAALPPGQQRQLPNAADGVGGIPGAQEAHSDVAAVPGNAPPAVPASEINSGVNSANSGEQKTLLQKTWALISKKPFGEWVKENRTPILIGAGIFIVAAALTTYIALSVALPGSSIFSAIPVVYAVHAAFVALHIPITIPWLVPAVSIALPALAIPVEIAIIYDAYVAVKGLINLWSFGKEVITKNADVKKVAEDIIHTDYVPDRISQPGASAQLGQSPTLPPEVSIQPASPPAAEEGEQKNPLEERRSHSGELQSENPQTGEPVCAAPSSVSVISPGRIEAKSREQENDYVSSSHTTGEKEKRRLSAEKRKATLDNISGATGVNGTMNVAIRTVAQPPAPSPAAAPAADNCSHEIVDADNNYLIAQHNNRKPSWLRLFKPDYAVRHTEVRTTSTSYTKQQPEIGHASAFRPSGGSSVIKVGA